MESITVFYDTETAGLDHEMHPLLQIAAVAVDEHFVELGEFEVKLQFDPELADQKALDVNGYSEEVWRKEAVFPREALNDFATWLRPFKCVPFPKRHGGGYWYAARPAGHNIATFDQRFLQYNYKHPDWQQHLAKVEGRQLPDWPRVMPRERGKADKIFLPLAFQCLDTYALATWWQVMRLQAMGELNEEPARRSGPRDLKLETLFEFFTGSPPEHTHEGLADVRSNIVVAQHLTQTVRALRP